MIDADCRRARPKFDMGDGPLALFSSRTKADAAFESEPDSNLLAVRGVSFACNIETSKSRSPDGQFNGPAVLPTTETA